MIAKESKITPLPKKRMLLFLFAMGGENASSSSCIIYRYKFQGMGRSYIVATKKELDRPFLLFKSHLRVLLKWDRGGSDLHYSFQSTSHQNQKIQHVSMVVRTRRNLHYSFPYCNTHIKSFPLESKFTQVPYSTT